VKTAVIVQARLGSTRLPGKVLLELAGRPVLAHVLERCRAIRGADVVCCATVAGPDGAGIASVAERVGAVVFCGSEDDVLARHHGAARAVGADVILRVTSDCPVIDPELCAAVIELRAARLADYACNNQPPTFPHGLDCEAFTFAWLDRAHREARRPSEREHVGPFIRTHPAARTVSLAGPGGDVARHRWTLDTPDDLTMLRALFAQLPPGPAGFGWRAALAVVTAHPEIAALNAGHDRDAGYRASLARDAALGFTKVSDG
jgi:spore coat polysaccharide biosynthesis protein SpsF (cytidylyltransferase family)